MKSPAAALQNEQDRKTHLSQLSGRALDEDAGAGRSPSRFPSDKGRNSYKCASVEVSYEQGTPAEI
jgi:hypothetical protein